MFLSRLGSGLLSVALLLPPAGDAFALPLPQGATSIPAVDVTAADFQATLESAIATGATDTPIRTIDAGGHHVGVALVQITDDIALLLIWINPHTKSANFIIPPEILSLGCWFKSVIPLLD